MLIAGVIPAADVRATWAAKPSQSTESSAFIGRRIADIPVITRRGRTSDAGSTVCGGMVVVAVLITPGE